jgi:FAD/FMN-containing dehydrogenase
MDNKRHDPLLEGFITAAHRDPPRLERDMADAVMERLHRRARVPRLLAAAILVPAAALFLLMVFLPDPVRDDAERAVTFSLQREGARSVSLVGDFNGWHATADPLAVHDGIWSITRAFVKGSFQKYAFLVDGELVVPHSDGSERVDDGFGGQVALVFVR